MRPRAVIFLVIAVLWAVPTTALAHVPFAGLNDLYNGILHPLVVPAHLLVLTAAGLFLGKQGTRAVAPSLLVFSLFTLAGLVATLFASGGVGEIKLLAAAALVGLLVAANVRVSMVICLLVAALAGFFLGLDSYQDAFAGSAKFFSLLGSGLGLCFLFSYAVAFADYFGDRNWQKIGVRIVGSWVAASAILVLALSMKSPMG